MENLYSFLKKSRFAALGTVLSLFLLAGSVFAATEFTTGGPCKDLRNDGVMFTGNVSIADRIKVEQWRDRVEVKLTDPNGVDGNAFVPALALTPPGRVRELILYAASDSTAYHCTQLTGGTNPPSSFSCNSFPKNGVIARVAVRFIPNFQGGGAPTDPVVTGKYTIKVNELVGNTELLDGHATIDAVSTACAWNQTVQEWIPDPSGPNATEQLIFNTNSDPTCHDGGVVQVNQALDFKDEPGKAFTIVSLPLGETFDENRVRFYGDKVIKEFDYDVELHFRDKANALHILTYSYTRDTNPADAAINPVVLTPGWGAAPLPIRFEGGAINIKTAPTPFTSLPPIAQFKFTFYYRNLDPTLGYENSMFHFQREMSVVFSPICKNAANLKYRTVNGSFDPCLATKQVFSVSFTNAAGQGYIPVGFGVPGSLAGSAVTPAYVDASIPVGTFASSPQPHWYFEIERCKDPHCNDRERQTGTYVHRIYFDDAEIDNRWWHYLGTTEANMRTYTVISMKTFKSATRPFEVKQMDVTVNQAGTYFVRAMMRTTSTSAVPGYPNNAFMEFYLTVPEKAGENTCSSSGTDGFYKVQWDACGENYDKQTVEFKAIDEKYGFISNYSALTLEYKFNPELSSMTSVAHVAELNCEWQLLADGYTVNGSGCYKDKIVLPPFTRAIIKGGKLEIPVKPTYYANAELSEFVMSYSRRTSNQNTNLFINAIDEECPREPIPDTGYSLRSPAPMVGAEQSGFIFTGNRLTIPAIGLGVEYPIEIVHINYLNGTDLSGGYNLKVLGGYVGELEGGAYLPYPGNTVLTGHYYSQGVFVNLTSLRFDDEIIIYGTDGYKYTYRVNNSFWTEPDDAYKMFQPNGERSLTLVTCDDYNFIEDKYLKRYIVQATIDSIEPYEAQ